MPDVQVTQDQHKRAFDWLEEHLENKMYEFDVGDVSAMVEQAVSGVV